MLKADITMESVEALGLEEGKTAYAVFKASSVMFGSEPTFKISARNRVCGKVVKCEKGAVNASVAIETKAGNVITGSITNEAVEDLGLELGAEAVAYVKSTEVMVGVE